MDELWKNSLWQQYGAAIDTLDDALGLCPDRFWDTILWEDEEDARYGQFWYVAYHALFWTDLFLSVGSLVMAPDVAERFVHWTSPTGGNETLRLVDFAMFPHLDNEMLPDFSMADAERWATEMEVAGYAIDDQTALKVIDGVVEVVSEGHWKLFTP